MVVRCYTEANILAWYQKILHIKNALAIHMLTWINFKQNKCKERGGWSLYILINRDNSMAGVNRDCTKSAHACNTRSECALI